MTVVLEVSDLVVEMRRHHRRFRAVDEVSLAVERGGSLGIVGESGCGKSVTLRAIMGVLPPAGRVTAGTVTVDGEPLSTDAHRARRDRRHRLAMVFQDALSPPHPVMDEGGQIRAAPQPGL